MGVLDALLDSPLREAFQGPGSPADEARKRMAGRPLTPAAKAADAKRGEVRPDSDFEKKHPRGGKGTREGGQFVKKGSSGDDVKQVQRKVGAKADGEYGSKTERAVREFQKKHGLLVDGVVGRQTALALRGKYKTARETKPGKMSKEDAAALKKHGRKKRERKGRAPERRSGGIVV